MYLLQAESTIFLLQNDMNNLKVLVNGAVYPILPRSRSVYLKQMLSVGCIFAFISTVRQRAGTEG